MKQVVLDTNVIIAALLSQLGASHKLLHLIDSGKFQINISVPLVLEYEYSSKELLNKMNLSSDDIDDVINYICKVANQIKVFIYGVHT